MVLVCDKDKPFERSHKINLVHSGTFMHYIVRDMYFHPSSYSIFTSPCDPYICVLCMLLLSTFVCICMLCEGIE